MLNAVALSQALSCLTPQGAQTRADASVSAPAFPRLVPGTQVTIDQIEAAEGGWVHMTAPFSAWIQAGSVKCRQADEAQSDSTGSASPSPDNFAHSMENAGKIAGGATAIVTLLLLLFG